MALPLRVEVSPIDVRDAVEIERAVTAFARSAHGGLIATSSGASALHHALVIALAAKHKLPTVYYERFFVAAGGLISYGPVVRLITSSNLIGIWTGSSLGFSPLRMRSTYVATRSRQTADDAGRKGRYQVHKLIAKYGRRGNMMKWREQLNGDCPR